MFSGISKETSGMKWVNRVELKIGCMKLFDVTKEINSQSLIN